MRSESDDQCLLEQSKSDRDTPELLHKESKISYTRNFLLSLSELDSCKRLPSGFDRSILGELEDSWTGLLKSGRNSDFGGYQGILSRLPCQIPEHGFIGSDAFPRVSGASAPEFQGNGYPLLNRTRDGAYQPPHLCKETVYYGRESKDFYNDETFGSSGNLAKEITEEETRRRESFERMRKAQHKALQEKQNKVCDVHKENLDPDIAYLLEVCGDDERSLKKYIGTESLARTSISEPCDVKGDRTNGSMLQSSDSADHFLAGVDESGSIKISHEGIIPSSCDKQTVVSRIEESSIPCDIQTKIGSDLESEPEFKLSPVSGLSDYTDSVDEICLPEEDSLITFDDWILPQNSTFVAAGSSVKANLYTSSSHVDNADKLADHILPLSNQNLHTQQSYPQFGHYQMNQGKSFFTSSDTQKGQMRSFESKTDHHNPQPQNRFPTNVNAVPFQHRHAELRKFGPPINSPLVQQMSIPRNFSSSQLPRGSPSQYPINDMTCYAQERYPTQNFPPYYQQQYYGGLGMPIQEHTASGISNQAAVNRYFETGLRANQNHPQAEAGRGSKISGKQINNGFRYGQ